MTRRPDLPFCRNTTLTVARRILSPDVDVHPYFLCFRILSSSYFTGMCSWLVVKSSTPKYVKPNGPEGKMHTMPYFGRYAPGIIGSFTDTRRVDAVSLEFPSILISFTWKPSNHLLQQSKSPVATSDADAVYAEPPDLEKHPGEGSGLASCVLAELHTHLPRFRC